MSKGKTLSYFPGLDGLRGLAVLLVIAFHFGVLEFGWAGVALFFVLSGFLITRILLETKDLGLGQFLGRFYWRRILRILPLYFGFVLSVGLIFAITGSPAWFSKHFPFLASFSYNFYVAVFRSGNEAIFHPLWSISLEEQFYLLWPILTFAFSRKAIGILAILLILLSPCIRIWEMLSLSQSERLQSAPVWQLLYYLPMGHLDAFAWGAIIAIFPAAKWTKAPLRFAGIMIAPILLYAFFLIFRYLFGFDAEFPKAFGLQVESERWFSPIWIYSLVYMAFAGLLILVLCTKSGFWIKRLAEWGPAKLVGRISYGMYIFHWPILLLFVKLWPLEYSQPIILVIQWKIYMLLILGAAWISHQYFESWFLSKKSLFFDERK